MRDSDGDLLLVSTTITFPFEIHLSGWVDKPK